MDPDLEKEREDLQAMREASRMYKPPRCRLVKDATVEELVDLYRHITGREPEPSNIRRMAVECEVTPPFDIKDDLTKSIKEEEEAHSTYIFRAGAAEETGDFQTSALYKHVAGEELEHKTEFEKRKEEI